MTIPQQPAPAPSTQIAPKGLAITALVVGIVAFITGWIPILGFIVGAAAVVFGVIALVKKQPKAFALSGLILGALAAVTSIAMTIGVALTAPAMVQAPEVSDAPAVTQETEEEANPAEQTVPTEAPGLTDQERTARFDQDLKSGLGVKDSYQELLATDATMWGGYIADIRVEGDRAYVTLQVDRNTPDGRDTGERAAQALSTLMTQETVETVNYSWIIVEDSTGVVIDQKQPKPLM